MSTKDSQLMTGCAPTAITEQIHRAVSEIPGWTPIDQLIVLYMLAIAAPAAGHFAEVGTWCGRSSVVLAMAARSRADALVHSIDLFPERSDWKQNVDGTWTLSVDLDGVVVTAHTANPMWDEPFRTAVEPTYRDHGSPRERFEQALVENHVQDWVVPWKGNLRHWIAGSLRNPPWGLAFLDGDHDYRAVADDIRDITPLLLPGAWLCLDDAYSVYPGVDQAIEENIVSRPDLWDMSFQATRKMFVARRSLFDAPDSAGA